MRVVSLVPSVTETLSMWGLEPVACTRFCERPDLTLVGGTKNPEIDAIIMLEPDLVVMDAEENRKADAEALTDVGLEVLALDVVSMDSLNRDLARLAAAVGFDAPALIERPTSDPLLRVAVPIWRRPWMTIGGDTYGSDLLAAIGAVNVCGDSATSYPEVSLADLAAREPDVVLVPSEPYVFTDEHLAELAVVAPPVRVDGQDLFWWGARTPLAIERLRAVIADLVTR
jgi:ABC-type Fe3+-hydroxamate transport system substrate-binding protein